jgi:acetolactate decarboxylase
VPTLTCEIPESLMRALRERSARTGEPVSRIVEAALSDALEIEDETLFQVSTATALVQGVSHGVVTIAELKEQGDFGLGTFDGLDGEMLAFDGRFYQVLGSGQVRQPDDDARVPFAVVTEFQIEREFAIERVASFDDLAAQLDDARGTDNLFYAVRIEGRFARVHTRAVFPVTSGVSLVEAASRQAEFDFADVAGTLVGFWTPLYARTLNIPGWHLHFLTAERTGGGHLLDLEAERLQVQMQDLADVRIAMPETPAFLHADLSEDPSEELEIAERGRQVGRKD